MSGTRGGVHNWTFGQGTTWRGEFDYLDATGGPIDLTGYTARMQIRPSPDSTDLIEDLSSEGGSPGILLGGSDGTISFTVHAQVTATVDAKTYKYDINITSPGGEVTRVLEGDINVTAAVTR